MKKLDAAEVDLRAETVCPFCGLMLAYAHQARGIVHGLPLCPQFSGNDVTTYLDLAAARVQLQQRGQRSRAST